MEICRFLIKVETQMASRKLAHLSVIKDIKQQSRYAAKYLLGLTLSGVLLSGCAMVGPGYEQPALPMLSTNYQTRDSQLQPALDLETWWQSFSDPTLDQLVSRALANNLTVQVAVERIVEAQANMNMKGRKLCPKVDSNCEVDLFGRRERSQQAAQAELLAKEYSLQDVQQTLIADVATSYLNIRLLQTQIEIVEKSLQLQQETTTLVSGRAKAGVVTKLDAEQTVAFLHRTRAERVALESQLDTEFNRIGILLGESPTSSLRDFVGFGPIPNAPYLPAAGIPADLIRRRADVRQAEAEVGAATARIGIAKADLYPRLRLKGLISPLSASPLAGNFFDFGRGGDVVAIHESQMRQTVGNYRITVLDAVKEVEDSMALYDGYQKQLAELEIALQSDAKAVELSLQRYEMGKSDFQRVIDVQMQMLEDSQASAETRAKANIQMIKLYNAVGGGWPTQTAAAGHGCTEGAAGHPNGYLGGCWGDSQSVSQIGFQEDSYPMNSSQPTAQFGDAQHSGASVYGDHSTQPTGSQITLPPQPSSHSILQTDDFGPIELVPDFGQNQQSPGGSTGRNVLTEMFDWDENEIAVVKSLRQNQSPALPSATAGYITDSPQLDSQRNTQKASFNRSAPLVWDSEPIKVD